MEEKSKKDSCIVEEHSPRFELTRRELIKSGALIGGSALLMNRIEGALGLLSKVEAAGYKGLAYPFADPKNVIYSVCLQCHTACPIKVKIIDGIAVKMDGNPYSPQNMTPHLTMNSPLPYAVKIDAKVCPKGQAGVQTQYDPYRIAKVLKRNGPRGSNRWRVIPFDQAIDEIVKGGKLFASIGENNTVSGFRDVFGLKDAKIANDMAADAGKVASGAMKVPAFKGKHGKNLGFLIDPDHPDLGPVNNQLVFQAGRIEHGRKELAKRWVNGSFGSVNFIEHTTICEQSHHIAYEKITDQYAKGAWKGGKHHMKPDALNSEFILFFGTGAFEANFGPPIMAEMITDGGASGRLKIAVVDPRLSKTAAKAWKWLPIKPSTDAALANGMIRYMIEHNRYDEKYLKNANKAAAVASGEPTWTNATYLVRIDDDGPTALLRAKDAGVGGEHQFVVISRGKPVAVTPEDGNKPRRGDLEFEGEINGIRVKTAFLLLKEYAFSKTLSEWSDICGIPVLDIEEVAIELTSHGKRACVEFYRGPVQHTNGYYNAQAIITLNMLVGNSDWKGGMAIGGGHWHEMGDKLGRPFDFKKMHPGRLVSFGHKITREKSSYEESTLFSGYPAKRPWFPFSSNVYQEIIPSAADGYPYSAKILWIHKGTPGYSTPAAHTALEILADPEKIPLVITTDIVIGETSMYADYIFPDTAIWERFGSPHTPPTSLFKSSKFRQPTVTPLTEVVEVYGEKVHGSMEAVMLAIGEKLGLPGCGKDAFGPGQDFTRPEDFYLKLAANIAWGDKKGEELPDADTSERKLFLDARRHLKPTVFDPKRWEKAVGSENWRKTIYLLNRGGRWEEWSKDRVGKDGFLKYRFGKMFNLYVEEVALANNSVSGERFSGLGIYETVRDASGKEIKDSDFPLALITYKDIFGGHSRTLPTNYWMSSILPENYILINTETAKDLRFSDGDRAAVISATNRAGKWPLPNRKPFGMVGKVKVIEGIRPGVVAVSWHFGHWGYGAADADIDGKIVKGDKRRGTGICINAALRVDPYLKNACMSDPIGGSSSFYDTRVKLVKA
ncbi:MAG: molybdopterin-dependent oxidoreductase [Deltaproteobacteria bacterium]|nr:molybdopterin-dependent oxidoreductase [Deltaproteobacteria bacterium]NIS78075.1 molybdopterin-dependent oxidoreductase [Deltaproteobacteria bacterium]